jgi:hypothetical protein
MRRVLHIVTRADDALAREVIARQREQPDAQREVADLTQPEPDYEALLDQLFAADSVAVW